MLFSIFFFFSSRRRHTRWNCDWSSDVCSSDLIAGAADRLFQTPSVTRQVQRLEAALGAELLDRSLKPPRLNSLGSRVLEQARDLLQRTEALKSLTSSDAEPHGLLRIGLA